MTLEELAQDKVVITIHGPYRPYMTTRSGPWVCILEKSGHGVELKVRGEGPTLEDAIDAALKKWKASVSGIEEFSGPLLEAPKPIGDDEIPF